MKKLISFVSLFALLLNSLVTPLSIFAQETATIAPEETIISTETSTTESAPAATPVEEVLPTDQPQTVTTDSTPAPTDQPIESAAPESNPTTPGPPLESPTASPVAPIEQGTITETLIENIDLSGITGINSNIQDSGTIVTDKPDYSPTSIVLVTGSGFIPNKTYTINIVSTDEPPSDFTDQVKADDSGNISYAYQLDGKYRPDYVVNIKNGENVVSTVSFTDANDQLNQCGNGTLASPDPTPCQSGSEWENGNLGASKSHYYEGDTIPYRLTMEGLSTSGSHTVTIEWDTTQADIHAIDYITSFNNTVNADPCAGVLGCSAYDTYAIPSDTQVTGALVTPIAGSFRLYGGDITSVGAYSYPAGSGFTGNKSAQITLTFTTSVANPVLAWGGHIANRSDWGNAVSAVSISGSPYHTRLIAIDGQGGNMDRSLSADAVIFPASITIIKAANPEGSTSFPFTASPYPLAGFSLVDDGTITNTKVFSNIINFQNYTVTENTPAGWSLDGIVCSVTSPNGGSQNVNGSTATINIKEGENVTCTYTNTLQNGTLTVQKTTIPALDPTIFTISATGSGTITGGGAGSISDAADHTYTVTAGTYSVSETVPTGWSKTVDTCQNVVVDAGEDEVCTITNTKLGKIIVEKQTLPDGSGQSFAFTASYDADGFSLTDGVQNNSDFLAPGAYSVSETVPSGWNLTNTSCTSSIADNETAASLELDAGETITCVFTNTQKGHIIVDKITNPTGSIQSFAFTAGGAGYSNFSLTDSANPNDQEVAPGLYSVSEGAVTGWDSNGGACDKGETPGAINVEPGETVTCTFTNTQRGTISGYKYEDRDGDGINDPDWTPVTGWVIELWQNQQKIDEKATDASGFYSFTNLVQGAYQLIEQVLGGWAKVLPTSGTIDVTLNPGENDTGNNFINTRYGTIIIEKQTLPNGSTQVFDFDSNFGDGDADLTDGQQDSTSNLLPGGQYSITETSIEGWVNSNTTCSDGSSPTSISLQSGETVTCVFTNTQLPKLTVTKTVINHGLTYDTSHFAPYQIDSNTVTLGQANILSIGPHTVTEVTDPIYNATFGGACNANGNVTLAAGDNLTCTITNEEISTSLTLVKTVTNNNGGGAVPTDWTLSADGQTDISGVSGSPSVTGATVNSGIYTLSESLGPANYTAGNWSCVGGSLIGNQLTLSSGQSATCTINNNDNAPSLRLRKTVTNDNGGNALASAWTLTATGAGQSPSNLSGATPVNSGVNFKADTYTLGESGPSGYTAGAWDCEGATMPDANHVVVPFGGNVTCRIVNNDNAPTLRLVKSVDYGPKSPADWTLTATGDGGFSDSGNSATFHAVKANVGYTLSESTVEGYAQFGSWSCDDGSLVGNVLTLSLTDQETTCTVVNHRDMGSLEVHKNIDLNGDGDWNDTSETSDSYANSNGFNWNFDAGEQDFGVLLSPVPTTTSYATHTISENMPSDYHFVSWFNTDEEGRSCTNPNGSVMPSTIEVLKDTLTEITLCNAHDTGTIKVDKVLIPANDNGLFNLQIDGITAGTGANVGNGGTTGIITVITGLYSVGEIAGTNTKLSDYETSIVCTDENNTQGTLLTNLSIEEGENLVCTITNNKIIKNISIVKSNDSGAGVSAGSTVNYKLEVTNGGNTTLYDVVISDILPGGFSYVDGSTVGANEPVKSGPNLTWSGFAPLTPGGIITINYKATTSSDLSDGVYTNYATCTSSTGQTDRESDFRQIFEPVNCNVVNSTVRIGSTLGYSGGLGGQVLGASTILPATGNPTWVLIAAFVALGTGIFLNTYANKKIKKNAKK